MNATDQAQCQNFSDSDSFFDSSSSPSKTAMVATVGAEQGHGGLARGSAHGCPALDGRDVGTGDGYGERRGMAGEGLRLLGSRGEDQVAGGLNSGGRWLRRWLVMADGGSKGGDAAVAEACGGFLKRKMESHSGGWRRSSISGGSDGDGALGLQAMTGGAQQPAVWKMVAVGGRAKEEGAADGGGGRPWWAARAAEVIRLGEEEGGAWRWRPWCAGGGEQWVSTMGGDGGWHRGSRTWPTAMRQWGGGVQASGCRADGWPVMGMDLEWKGGNGDAARWGGDGLGRWQPWWSAWLLAAEAAEAAHGSELSGGSGHEQGSESGGQQRGEERRQAWRIQRAVVSVAAASSSGGSVERQAAATDERRAEGAA